jgi:hypothetical protein
VKPSDNIYAIIRVQLPYILPRFGAGAANYSQVAAGLQVSLQRLHLDRSCLPGGTDLISSVAAFNTIEDS